MKRHQYSLVLSYLELITFAIILNLSSSAQTPPQPFIDSKLQQQVENLVRGFHGDVGVYIRNLSTGKSASYWADSLFPTAAYEIPILCGIIDHIRKGALTFESVVTYRDSMKYDDGFTGSLKDSTKVPLGELVHQLLTLSDNTASVWLERLAGGGIQPTSGSKQMGFIRRVSIAALPTVKLIEKYTAGDKPHHERWPNFLF